MSKIRGTRLYVEMGASQVRRRLKGHGFGVRKIASAGKGRALIIHTATGQHQRDLEALFPGMIVQPTLAKQDVPTDREGRGVHDDD